VLNIKITVFCSQLQLRLGLGFEFRVKVRVRIGLELAFFKDLCNSNAHQKLVHNIGSKFDDGACN